MLDIKFIRDNSDLIREAARKKHVDFDVKQLIEADDKRRALLQEVEEMRAEQNKANEAISSAQDESEKQTRISEMKDLKETIQKKEEMLKEVMKEWQKLMLQVPNVPDATVPEGKDDAENKEVKQWGEKPNFSFEPKNHMEIMTELDMADFERGTKVSGFRGYFLKNDGALLSFAIWQYAQQFFLEKGFTPMIPPTIVRPETMLGTGYIPQGEEDIYKTQDGDYLVGTAEVPAMGYYMEETLEQSHIPVKFLAFSPAYRREAGSHGKDTKGLIRVHEFYKWEQVVLCEADHEKSVKWHEWLNRNTEEFIESLGIPYRTVINCGGDLGLGQVKKYDIELWVPLENTYREISSASYFHDFQTRRLGIKYKDKSGESKFAHSLNSTAIPTPRILVSLIENFQQNDGSVKIPEPLQKYMGKETITKNTQ